MLALAYRSVGSRADAEDVAQTTFLDAHRALVRGTRPANERAWLLAIARNVCHRRYRALAQRPREEPLDESRYPASDGDVGTGSRVIDAINTLPDRQREVIVLHALHGCTTAELGERLGLGASAADALLFRARAALRDALEAGAQPLACAQTETLVAHQLTHQLDEHQRTSLRAHLRACPSCATRARSLRARKRSSSLLAWPCDLLSRLGAGLAGPAGLVAKTAAVLALAVGGAAAERDGFSPTRDSIRPRTTSATVRSPAPVGARLAARPQPQPLATSPGTRSTGARSTSPAPTAPLPSVATTTTPTIAPLVPARPSDPSPAPESAATTTRPTPAPAPSSPPSALETVVAALESVEVPGLVVPGVPEVPVPELPEVTLPAVPELPVVEAPELPTPDVPDLANAVAPPLPSTDVVTTTANGVLPVGH